MSEPLLELRGLKKSYRAPDGTTTSVIDLPEFRLARGEQVALRGGSGSGKTTLLHLIAGILTPDEGSVRVAGVEFTALSEPERDRARARSIGYVFQSFHLLPAHSALENVLLAMHFGRGCDALRARTLLERVGLSGKLDHRPGQLSVGQQQRVAVARALAGKPDLVLADEPTGNLDRERAREALALIREVCREEAAGLLLVSHDAQILGEFERVVDLAELARPARQGAAK